MTALKSQYSWQATYTSPNDNRYVYTIEDPESGVSIDVFNADSGDAESHSAMEILLPVLWLRRLQHLQVRY